MTYGEGVAFGAFVMAAVVWAIAACLFSDKTPGAVRALVLCGLMVVAAFSIAAITWAAENVAISWK